jgi:hypothetical protein
MKTSFLSLFAPSALLSLALAGCTGPDIETAPPASTVTLQDDSDPFGPNEGVLHPPYVPGATFQITLTTIGPGSWTVTSSDPSVLSLTPEGGGSQYNAHAGAPGHVTITVQNASGLVIASPSVDVVMPTVARLYAPGRMIAGQSDALAQEATVNVESSR